MKVLKTLAVKAAQNNFIETVVASINGMEVKVIQDVESAIDEINNRNFDLLMLDKNLPEIEFKKIQKLTAILHPDAAVVEMNFNDREMVHFKLTEMMGKWQEANDERSINISDNLPN